MTKEVIGSTTYNYTYDTYGNIRSKTTTSGTTASFTYGTSGWLDKLLSYNGNSISYDAIGNPTKWHDGSTFTWTNGKQLTAATAADGTVLSYSYDADGLRLTKVVDGVTHNYLWQGDRLVSEQYGTTELEFFYDESGTPYALDYNGTIYYYITNLQGDVIGIVDTSGAIKAKYTYNAWGEDIDTTAVVSDIETINPLRYRGYFFDRETGLYYLQSRYYDPVVCRFINADDFPSTGQSFLGFNMFAYCCNNPISMTDSEGELGVLAAVAITAGIVGFVVSAASTALENLATGRNVMDGVISSGLGGATYNVVSVFTGNPIAAGYASALVESASGEIINYAAGKKEPTPENLKESAGSVLGKTLIKGTAYAFTGKMADKFLPIDFGEMVTRSVLKSDLFKIAEQTVIQSAEYLLGKGIYNNFTSFGMAQ